MFYAVVLLAGMGFPMVQINDTKGPYSDIPTCYLRGSEIIRESVTKGNLFLISATALCIPEEQREEEKEKPLKEKGIDS